MASLANRALRIALPALIVLMSGCSIMPDYPARYLEAPMTMPAAGMAEPDEVAVEPPGAGHNERLTRLYQQYDEWHRVKYKSGGMSKSGTDCSGFVKQTFATLFDITLPRDTLLQAKAGADLDKSELRPGDLVFFRINNRTQHVGIYLEEDKFLHASTSRGVMISSMTHPYWQNRYWKSVRVEG
jgi:lipoprotein Spr/probable lipoprotein NlpC